MVLLSLRLTIVRQNGGGGEFFDVGQQKKSKGYKGHSWPGAKKCPHNKRKLIDGTVLRKLYCFHFGVTKFIFIIYDYSYITFMSVPLIKNIYI